jgi:Na+/melibiose symporter-like transporter
VPVVNAVAKYMNCTQVGPYFVLADYPSVSCDSDVYLAWYVYPALLFIFYIVGGPAAIFLFLWRFANRANKGNKEQNQLEQSNIRLKYGTLFISFTSERYYWAVLSLFRRTCLIFIMVFFHSDKSWQLTLVVTVNLTSLLAHIYAQPYRNQVDNKLETASLLVLVLLTITLGCYESPLPTSVQVFTFLLLAVSTICAAICAAIMMRRMRQAHDDKRKSRRTLISPNSASPGSTSMVSPHSSSLGQAPLPTSIDMQELKHADE